MISERLIFPTQYDRLS